MGHIGVWSRMRHGPGWSRCCRPLPGGAVTGGVITGRDRGDRLQVPHRLAVGKVPRSAPGPWQTAYERLTRLSAEGTWANLPARDRPMPRPPGGWTGWWRRTPCWCGAPAWSERAAGGRQCPPPQRLDTRLQTQTLGGLATWSATPPRSCRPSASPSPTEEVWSTDAPERLHTELKRHTDILGVFPEPAALLRLTGAVLVEVHDQWQLSDRRYSPKAPWHSATDPMSRPRR